MDERLVLNKWQNTNPTAPKKRFEEIEAAGRANALATLPFIAIGLFTAIRKLFAEEQAPAAKQPVRHGEAAQHVADGDQPAPNFEADLERISQIASSLNQLSGQIASGVGAHISFAATPDVGVVDAGQVAAGGMKPGKVGAPSSAARAAVRANDNQTEGSAAASAPKPQSAPAQPVDERDEDDRDDARNNRAPVV